jgi:hypothetical protein
MEVSPSTEKRSNGNNPHVDGYLQVYKSMAPMLNDINYHKYK